MPSWNSIARTHGLAVILALSISDTAYAQHTFWLSRDFLSRLEVEPLLAFPLELNMTQAVGPVHNLANDCELHVPGMAATGLFTPRAVVVEPPNVCRFELPEGGTQWRAFFRDNVGGRECTVTGYMRMFAEHWENAGGGSNPRHMMEIHPALGFDCIGSNRIDLADHMTVFTGMRQIQGRSLQRCFELLSLEVRSRSDGYDVRFNHPPSCGNFAIIRATFSRSDVFEIDGGHLVSAAVRACEQQEDHAARFFTYAGTEADDVVSEIRRGLSPIRGMNLHAMLAYDWDSILGTVSTNSGDWAQITDWRALEQPLAFVVFDETTEVCRR